MKRLKTYEELNESWRQVKMWLSIPSFLFKNILSRIIDYVHVLDFKYDKMSAKIDSGSSLRSDIFKEEPIKLTMDDIKNTKMKNTLKFKKIFEEWNVYSFDRTNSENRQPVYITKDELKRGDKYYSERISDRDVDRKYIKKQSSSDEEPQFYMVAAIHTEEHDEMRKERDERYLKKKINGLKKEIKNIIKSGDFSGRTKQTYGFLNNKPIAFKIIDMDAVDLMKDLLDGCPDDSTRKKLISPIIDEDGWTVSTTKNYLSHLSYNYSTVMDDVNSQQMRDLISPYFESYLEYIVKYADLKQVKKYFESGKKIENKDTILKVALDNKQPAFTTRASMVKILLDNGANIDFVDFDMSTLTIASKKNDIELVKLLLDYDVDIPSVDFIDELDDKNKKIIENDYPEIYKKYIMGKKIKGFNL